MFFAEGPLNLNKNYLYLMVRIILFQITPLHLSGRYYTFYSFIIISNINSKMQQKPHKCQPNGSFFYLKITFAGKTKKFIVRNLKLSLKQIRNSFSPQISSSNIKIEIQQNGSPLQTFRTEQELINHLKQIDIPEGDEIRINIVEEVENRIEQLGSKEYDMALPIGIHKVRSRSQQIELEYKTQSYVVSSNQLEATQQFLYQSLNLVDQTVEEAQRFLQETQRRILKYSEESRETDICQLMRFLSDY